MRYRSLDHADCYLAVRKLRAANLDTRFNAARDVRDPHAAWPGADVLPAPRLARGPALHFQFVRVQKHVSAPLVCFGHLDVGAQPGPDTASGLIDGPRDVIDSPRPPLDIHELTRTRHRPIVHAQKEKSVLERCYDLQQKLEKVAKEVQVVENEQETFKPDAFRLLQHEQISEWAGELATLQSQQTQLKGWEERRKTLQTQIETQTTIIETSHQQITHLVQKSVPKEHLLAELNVFEGEILQLDTEIEKLNAEIRPVFTAIKQEVSVTNHPWLRTLSVEKLDEAYALLQQKKQEIQQEVARFRVDFEAEKELAQLANRQNALMELKATLTRRNEWYAQGLDAKKALEESKRQKSTNDDLNGPHFSKK